MRAPCLSVAVLLGAASVAASADEADVAALAERLRCEACARESIAQARQALRRIAAGPVGDPRTRAAVFALARAAADAPPSDGTVGDLMAAVTLYPDDPVCAELLPALARAQLATGDTLGAHFTFNRWLERGGTLDASTRLQAVENAVAVRDAATAFRWLAGFDPAGLAPGERARLDRATLKAAAALGRDDVARRAWERLQPEEITADPEALLAAARLCERGGEAAQAASLYERFVNVYPEHRDWADAAVALGRLQVELGHHDIARATLGWVVERYPESVAADEARFELARLESEGDARALLASGMRAVREATTPRGAERGCCELLEAAEGASGPLVAAEVAVRLAADEGLAALAARKCVASRVERWVERLRAEGDRVRLAALAATLAAHALPVSRRAREELDAARSTLGLPSLWNPAAERLLDEARAEAAAGRWEAVDAQLAPALASLDPSLPAWATLVRLAAEARWRTGREAEALARVDRALARAPEGARRALLVLKADMLFASRAFSQACALYAEARRLGPTPWVEVQVERCERVRAEEAL